MGFVRDKFTAGSPLGLAQRSEGCRDTQIDAATTDWKRRGKLNRGAHSSESCHIFALVALDEKQIGYMKNEDIKQTMFFRVESLRGTYRDENINTPVRGRYLSDLRFEDAVCQK